MNELNPVALLQKYCPPDSRLYDILLRHSRAVARKALAVADRLAGDGIDRRFLEEAALLHDIGVVFVKAPEIGCEGAHPYVCHGVLGREILEREGLPRHAVVCETHVGVGITREEILREGLPLPPRDMLPQSLEEEIIAFADKFFTKEPDRLEIERPVEDIRRSLRKYGEEKIAVFDRWLERFGG